jgi:hypothetical protein
MLDADDLEAQEGARELQDADLPLPPPPPPPKGVVGDGVIRL